MHVTRTDPNQGIFCRNRAPANSEATQIAYNNDLADKRLTIQGGKLSSWGFGRSGLQQR